MNARELSCVAKIVFERSENKEGYSDTMAFYLLHSFQKKSKHGIATPKQDIELVKKRLKIAQENYLQQTTEKME
ncbi:type II toxin-antitoxin system RelE/ParE family toxin [Dolichospermum sp. ST_sed9]|jgi:hypothetical protein|nr:type II toxin-antitoxin system RelE/ParE family toxin [Dolichospermum sp. ST_sed9]